MREHAKVVVREETVLEKFEGDALVERVYILNGQIQKNEFFEDGKLVNTKIGGNHASN